MDIIAGVPIRQLELMNTFMERDGEFIHFPSKRHCCLIYKHNSLISVGINRLGVNSFVTKFAPNSYTIHAEVDAMLKVKDRSNLKGCIAYVARFRKDGKAMPSKPCKDCQCIMEYFGIKVVYHS